MVYLTMGRHCGPKLSPNTGKELVFFNGYHNRGVVPSMSGGKVLPQRGDTNQPAFRVPTPLRTLPLDQSVVDKRAE